MKATSTFVNRAWIKKSFLCGPNDPHPRKVKAYVIELKNDRGVGGFEATIADSELQTDALFTQEALFSFSNEDTCEDVACLKGAYITITDFKVYLKNVDKDPQTEGCHVLINGFKYFGPAHCSLFSRHRHSSQCPEIQRKILQLSETNQIKKLCERYTHSIPFNVADDGDCDQLLDYLVQVHSTVCYFPGSNQQMCEENLQQAKVVDSRLSENTKSVETITRPVEHSRELEVNVHRSETSEQPLNNDVRTINNLELLETVKSSQDLENKTDNLECAPKIANVPAETTNASDHSSTRGAGELTVQLGDASKPTDSTADETSRITNVNTETIRIHSQLRNDRHINDRSSGISDEHNENSTKREPSRTVVEPLESAESSNRYLKCIENKEQHSEHGIDSDMNTSMFSTFGLVSPILPAEESTIRNNQDVTSRTMSISPTFIQENLQRSNSNGIIDYAQVQDLSLESSTGGSSCDISMNLSHEGITTNAQENKMKIQIKNVQTPKVVNTEQDDVIILEISDDEPMPDEDAPERCQSTVLESAKYCVDIQKNIQIPEVINIEPDDMSNLEVRVDEPLPEKRSSERCQSGPCLLKYKHGLLKKLPEMQNSPTSDPSVDSDDLEAQAISITQFMEDYWKAKCRKSRKNIGRKSRKKL